MKRGLLLMLASLLIKSVAWAAVVAGMNYAFLGTPYSFNWQDFIMQAAISSALGGFTSGIQAKISGKTSGRASSPRPFTSTRNAIWED